MHTHRATRRLQQVQRIIDGDTHSSASGSTQTPGRKRVLILPDGSDVYVSEPGLDASRTISIDDDEVMRFRPLARTAALVLSALGTQFEADNPVPKYPIVELAVLIRAGDTVGVFASDIWTFVYALWTLFHSQENIPILFSSSSTDAEAHTSYLLCSGLARAALDPKENALFLLRGTFWQGAGTGPAWGNTRGWLRYTPDHCAFPHVQSFTRSSAVIAQHPLRPPKPPNGTVIYRRFCTEVGLMFSFHVFNPDDTADMNAFHRWMNDERVNTGWGERGDMEKHRAYAHNALADPAVLPLIMSWDGERMGYCEMVWTKENHLAPYIPFGAHDYDRGMHVLVGEDKFRGRVYSKIWFRTILHCIFLADARTERMVGEPKVSNTVAITLGHDCGMHGETTFYFPYKHSSLEVGLRERFFKEDMLV